VKSIVVTGAAGLIGSHLCEGFAQAGWEVRAIDRPGAGCVEARAAGASVAEINLDQPQGSLAAAEVARGATLFAHCAFPRDVDRVAALSAVRTACAAALQANAPLLLLSSCSVYGRPANLPCEEGDPKTPVDLEGEVRWAVEREAWTARRERGLQLIVLRPSMTYGPRQRRGLQASLVVAALAARAGRALWLPRRGPVVHPVHAADVAQAALLLAESGAATHDGRAFNVADDAPLPLEELTRAVLEAAGAQEAGALPYSPLSARFFLWVLRGLPNWMFWGPLNRRLARAWLLAYRGQPPVPPPQLGPGLLEQFSADRYFDTRKLRLLGFSPTHSNAVEGLNVLARESRAKGLLPAPQAQLEG